MRLRFLVLAGAWWAGLAVAADGNATEAVDAGSDSGTGLQWRFDWRGWDGLSMELVQPTPFEVAPALPRLRLDQVRLAGTLGVRIEVDGAAFGTNGGLTGFNDGVELRRARVRLAGDAILGTPLRYKVEFGYSPGQFTLEDFYVAVPDLPLIGTFQAGQFRPTQGLQLLTSSWDIELMEPAATLQALGPESSPGMRIGSTVLDGRATWSLGGYGSDKGGAEYGTSLQDMTSAAARLTWLAIDDAPTGATASSRFLHLGLSATHQRSGGGEVRYRSRPESYLAPYVIDTQTIAADRAYTLGGELLWVDGPLSAQFEVMRARVAQTAGPALSFGGAYAMASWTLTGESREYRRDSATLARLRPRRNFELGPEGGWGALQAALRCSYTDLSDANVAGGRLYMLMAGLDWTFRPQLQWMIDVGAGSVRDGPANGRMLIVQTRLGLYF